MENDDFATEEITRTIPGLANAIATGSATALVYDDARDAEAHTAWSNAASVQRARSVR